MNPTQLNVFPNPGNGKITLSLSHLQDQIQMIEIYSLQGALCMTVAYSASDHSIDLDVSSLPAGLYALRATTHTSVWTQKLILTH